MFQLVMQIAGMAQRDKLLEGAGGPLVAVAIDRDKSSQSAFRWALDNLVTKGQTLTLIHVNSKASSGYDNDAALQKEVFVPFRCFCTRKDIQYKEVVLEDTDVVTAIVDFVANAAIEKLVIGASPKGGFVRTFRNIDISNSICKGVADFCTVYVISKGKVSSVRNAVRSAPIVSPFRNQIQGQPIPKPEVVNNYPKNGMRAASEAALSPWNLPKENDSVKSPFTRGGRAATAKSYGDLVMERDISFVSSGRPSVDRPHRPRRLSNISDFNLDFNFESPRKSVSFHSTENDFFSLAHDSSSSHVSEDVETEIRRLRIELEQTMKMYSTACKEALTAKQKAKELQRWKMEEEQKMKKAREAEEAALALVEKEKAKCLVAIQTAEASKRIAESEAQKRISAEMKSVKEAEQGKKGFEAMSHIRYRKYTIEEIEVATEYFAENRKIGEGGYGPVYRGTLDHTPVAIKVLRPDAAQGRVQFQQEVEILCCIRHPNMVLLLGACPEYGCLVYEYMANGSLEDRLLRRGNTPPIPWQHRFRIAAEIGTGLLFLHQTKPEPLVHRDLKPANILLDRNYVSKIGDVGLARLVPPSVADNVTQCRMTATAGTFCYIDPEYQQTGMLGVKSDIYSLGILLLQLLTGKPPMAISHNVERAIEKGNFLETLDPAVPDWPLEEALSMAKLSIKCAELRRKDRPDLATVVLPELNRLRDVAEENSQQYVLMNNRSSRSRGASPIQTQVSTEELMSGPPTSESVYESTLSQFSAAATMSGIGRY